MAELSRLDVELVRESLETSSVWTEVIYHRQVGSTNDLAKDLATRGAPAGTVVVADEQTAGRGRLGRRWIAPPCTGLLCSMLFRPDLELAQVHRLTMLCSLAAADAVESLTGLALALKWPNDIIARSGIKGGGSRRWRKLAGVLTETGVSQATLSFVVVGIGINVNVPVDRISDLAPDATSIMAETMRPLDRSALLIELLESAGQRYERLTAGENPHSEWSARLATLGGRVLITTTADTFEGVAEAVDENGALLLRTRGGALRRVFVGDVTLDSG